MTSCCACCFRPRADKVAERLVLNAYSRAIQGFESYDTTILMA